MQIIWAIPYFPNVIFGKPYLRNPASKDFNAVQFCPYHITIFAYQKMNKSPSF